MPPARRAILLRRIAATPEAVYAAWTHAERIAHWWAGDGAVMLAKADARIGGSFEIVAADDRVDRGRFRELVPGEIVYLDWEGDVPGTVTVQLWPIPAGGTEITLTHAGFATDADRDARAARWAAALTALERYLAPA
jgi:uncharacterized protein YndB with AHSA1/START domain